MSDAMSCCLSREVLDKIDESLADRDQRKRLHENLFFGSHIREQWKFLEHSASLSSHHALMGIPKLGDDILYYQQRSASLRAFGWRTETICYPPKVRHHLRKAIISGIAVIDSFRNGNGGESRVVRGGVGASFVEIELVSRWFRGFAFTVVITGKYIDGDDGERKSGVAYQRLVEKSGKSLDNIKMNNLDNGN